MAPAAQEPPKKSYQSALIRLGAVLLAVLALAVFTSCKTTVAKGAVDPRRGIPEGQSAIFGQIRSETQARSRQSRSAQVSVMDVRRSIPVLTASLPTAGDAELFCWHLPPGAYAIYDYGVHFGEHQNSVRLYAEFQVASPGVSVYVGCLNLPASVDQRPFVTDDFDHAISELKARYPLLPGVAVKSLIKLEEKR